MNYRTNTKYIADIDPKIDGNSVINVAGWIHEIRNLGGICFIILRDITGISQITIIKKNTDEKLLKLINSLSRESVIFVTGVIKLENKVLNGYEIIPSQIQLLSCADVPLPMDTTEKVEAELDTRLESRYLDLRRDKIATIFKLRSFVLQTIRDYFYENKFIESTTPKIVAAATEGGTELFPITYFEKTAFLNQSPQLFKQILMSSGLDRVFEIGPIFRAEEHNTRKHLNEATSIDVEISFANDTDAMEVLENLIKKVYLDINDKQKILLDKLGLKLKIPQTPFMKYKYSEVIEILNKEVKNNDEELSFGDDLTTKSEYKFGDYVFQTTGQEHYFIIDWPSSIKPFYAMKDNINNKISKSFDLMHRTMELSSGAQRCHSYNQLCIQIKEKGLNVNDFDFYLNSFKYGMPPHSGFGVGLERLIMTILNLKNIREAVLFPRDKTRLSP